jgi:glutaredoxin/glutathione-dependent peroxiredoxin
MFRLLLSKRVMSSSSGESNLMGKKLMSAANSTLQAMDGEEVSMEQLFAKKKVVVFGVPGAFTPVCSNKHVPEFIEKAEALREKGVEQIVCVSVNDRFVLDAWGIQLKVGDSVEMLADWNASFVRELGLDVDLGDAGLGVRAKRFSMLVDDGRVVLANVEDSPGDYTATGPQPILDSL